MDDLVEHADLRIQLSEKRIRGQLTVLDSSGKSLDSKRVPQLFSRSDWVDLDVTKGISNKNKQVSEVFFGLMLTLFRNYVLSSFPFLEYSFFEIVYIYDDKKYFEIYF